ncbi:MAG TPA: hypothetical protein DCR21_05615, partial [Succinivibrionaceae bacterium]|nr:hypothetical protein [Succinivibrionaceae bacterium]
MIRKIFSLACFGIGVFMYSGANAIEYTAIDNAPIEKLIKACEAGDGDICRRVARAYFYGNNVKIDFKNAVLYHQKACDLDVGGSCNNLGYSYQEGLGVNVDMEKSCYAYLKGCNLNNNLACINLANLYRDDDYGIPRNKDKAALLYAKALKISEEKCADDDTEGCRGLAILYNYGRGVKQSDEK